MSVSTDITYWTKALKMYISSWVTDNAHKEEYGEEECSCDWMKLILANELICIMQGYTVSSSYNIQAGTTPPTADPCLVDADIEHIFQLSSAIINSSGGCS